MNNIKLFYIDIWYRSYLNFKIKLTVKSIIKNKINDKEICLTNK